MQPTKARKRLLWTGGSILIVALILILSNSIASIWYRPLIRKTLTDLVSKSTRNQYTLQIENIQINFLLGRISLKKISLEPDEKVYEQLKNDGLAPPNRYHLHAKELFISITEIHRAFFSGLVHINKFRLENPEIFIENDSLLNNLPLPVHVEESIKKPLSQGLFTALEIENIDMLNGHISYIRRGLDHQRVFKLNGAHARFHAENLSINKGGFNPVSLPGLLESINFTLSLESAAFEKMPGLYTYTAGKVRISKADNEVSVEKLTMLPQFKVANLYPSIVEDPGRDFLTLKIENIRFRFSSFFTMLRTGQISIPHVLIEGADFNYHSDGIPRLHPGIFSMPQELLRNFSSRLNLDSIEIVRSMIRYQDYNALIHKSGIISFNEINGLITNLTNDPSALKKNPALDIAIRTRLFNKGDLQLKFNFNLLSKTDSFSYSGSMGYFPLITVNQITVPLSALQIIRGYSKKCSFDVQADETAARGHITGYYNKLSIKLLPDDSSANSVNHMKTMSSLANMFVVLNDNPLSGQSLRTEEINVDRETHRSFFRYLWKSLLSGIKPSIGLNKGRQEGFASFINRFHHFSEWHHAGAQARQKRRQKRRQLRELIRESHSHANE